MVDKETIKKALAFPGITPRESAAYIAALEIKQPTALRISKQIGLPRATTYRLIESLIEKGLIGRLVEDGRTVFVPEKPDAIVQRLKLQAESIKKILPDLGELFDIYKHRPKVRLFEGREGMKRVCDDILDSGAKELLSFADVPNLFNILPDYYPAFVKKRVKKNIRARVLAPRTNKALARKSQGEQEIRDVRFVPEATMHQFKGTTFVYRDRIAFLSFSEDLNAIIIEHAGLADMQRALFEQAWAQSES